MLVRGGKVVQFPLQHKSHIWAPNVLLGSYCSQKRQEEQGGEVEVTEKSWIFPGPLALCATFCINLKGEVQVTSTYKLAHLVGTQTASQ